MTWMSSHLGCEYSSAFISSFHMLHMKVGIVGEDNCVDPCAHVEVIVDPISVILVIAILATFYLIGRSHG